MNWSCCCSVAFLCTNLNVASSAIFLWNPFVFKLYIIPCFTLLKVIIIIYCKRQCLTDLVKHKLPQNRDILLKGRFTSLVGNTKTQWLPSFPTNVFADWTRNWIIVLQVFQPIGSFVGVYFGYPWGRALWCSAFKYTSLFCPVIVVQANLIHFQRLKSNFWGNKRSKWNCFSVKATPPGSQMSTCQVVCFNFINSLNINVKYYIVCLWIHAMCIFTGELPKY